MPPARAAAPVAVPLSAPVLERQDTDYDQAASAPGSKPTTRRVATVGGATAVLATVAAVAIALLTGRGPGPVSSREAGDVGYRAGGKPPAPPTIGMYSGQQQRGVFQRIDNVAGYSDTIVTTGSQSSDGQVRQQFFVSTDGGANWRLAPLRAAGGDQAPLGHAATTIAGGPAGWLAVGPRAIWTSRDGLSWTLAAAHGMAAHGMTAHGMTAHGMTARVLTGTASGFLAGGAGGAGQAGGAAAWVSRDGTNWQAARLELAQGETVRAVSSAASHGPVTVISGTVARGAATYAAVWLSTGSRAGQPEWTRVTVPADHDAAGDIVGLSSDAAGLLAVRPGRTAGGVAYFSQNGKDWRYAGTIDPSGGWSPTAVSGGGGFAVTGKTASGEVIAYTGTGTGTAWTPTRVLGSGDSALSPAVGAGGTVVTAGSTGASEVGQQGVLLEATRAGSVLSVPLARLPGAVVPELAMNAMAAAGDVQVAVGSANGYPAIWRRQHGGSWVLVSPSALTSGQPHLAALTGVTRGPHGWLAVGVPGPLAFTSADGVTWQPAAGNIAQDLAGVSTVAVAAGPAGYVVAGSAGVWYSPDLTSWSRVRDVTGSSQVLAVAADARGFVAVGSRDGKPAAWTTTDGRSWTTIVLPVPAGASSAVLQQVAIKGNRIAVLGQATNKSGAVPFAVLSADGARWRRVPFASPGPDTDFTALIAGSRGFTAVGQYGQPGQVWPAAWTSTDGTVWTRAPLSGFTGAYRITALAPAGSAATAIGSIATQASQGAFMVNVP